MWKKVSHEQMREEANKRGQMLNEILELHQPEQIFDGWYCSHCLEDFDHGTDQATYPCETVKIIITKE